MPQKHLPHMTVPSHSKSRPGAGRLSMHDTDFEEDDSDLEEYSGRRSEDSVSAPPCSHVGIHDPY